MLPEHTRSVKLFCNIDASALAAVMFVLVVVMMVAESAPHHGFGPDLPHVSHAGSMPGANRKDAMVIAVMRDGKVFFGNEHVRSDQLPSKILDRLKDRSVERRCTSGLMGVRGTARLRKSSMAYVLLGL